MMLSNPSNCCRDTNFNALDNIRYFEHEKEKEERGGGHSVEKLFKKSHPCASEARHVQNLVTNKLVICSITSQRSSHEWKMFARIPLLYAASIRIFTCSSEVSF